jgi:hypothetical protein
MKLFLALIAFLSICNTSASQTIPVDNNVQWALHTDTVFHFSFSAPDNWEFKPVNTKTRFFVTSYKENEADSFRENLNCMAKTIAAENINMHTIADALQKSLSEKFADYKLVNLSYNTWNGADAMQLEYTCTQQSQNQSVAIHMFQQVAIKNNTLFTLTFTSEARSYDRYIGIVKKMIRSFKIQ